MFIKSLKKGF